MVAGDRGQRPLLARRRVGLGGTVRPAVPLVSGSGSLRRILAGAVLAGFLLHPAEALARCVMCSTSIGANRLGRGLAISVLFLLGTLVVVVLWIVFLIVREHRRDARRGLRTRPGLTSRAGASPPTPRESFSDYALSTDSPVRPEPSRSSPCRSGPDRRCFWPGLGRRMPAP